MTKSGAASGSLVIIGGSEDHFNERKILREFVRLAGESNAKIVVVTVASEAQSEVGDSENQNAPRVGRDFDLTTGPAASWRVTPSFQLQALVGPDLL